MDFSFIDGMNLGLGFTTSTYDVHPVPALDNITSIRDVVNAGGQEVLFRVELASNTLSLTEQLNVSASASLKFGMNGSGSAKTSFLSKFKQNSYTIYVLVQVTVTNKQTLLDLSQSKLKPEAEKLFSSNPQQFIQQFGDSFVYGLITGGEFIGVLEIESSSSSQFQDIKTSLSGKASYGLFSGNAKASFEQSLEKITSNYQMKATVFRQGGKGGLQAMTPDNLIKEALNFPDAVNGSDAKAYTALVIPYNHIPHPVTSALDVSNQSIVLEQIGAWRQRLLKYQNDLTFALNHQNQFPGIDVNAVNTRFNQISDEITRVVNAARDCFNDQSKCPAPKFELTLLENVLPSQTGDDDMAKLEDQIQQLANDLAATKAALNSAQGTANSALQLAQSAVKDVKFFIAEVHADTTVQDNTLNLTFPERVDAVALESIVNDGNQMIRARINRRIADNIFEVFIGGGSGNNHRWIPILRFVGIQIQR